MGLWPTLSMLYAVSGLRMLFALRGIRLPLANALKILMQAARRYLLTTCNAILFIFADVFDFAFGI
jgi:hypothetical protein